MENRKYDQKRVLVSTTQIIILSFLGAILIGAFLLMMPISSASGRPTAFIDALFTATTSVCVTGLVTVTTAAHWSFFGKIIILLLIQMGGLGVAAMAMLIFMIMGRKLSLGYRKLLGDSFNLDTLSGLARFLRSAVMGSFFVEGIGALCYMPVFIKNYGVGKGIWYSIFNSISAFCNAGIDILGPDSLVPYVHHTWVNLVTILLIVMGGIGFIVWWDVLHVIKSRLNKNLRIHNLTLHSKIILSMTGFLIAFGAIMYFLFEHNNPETIGTFTLYEKMLACLFQSVTTRTAGFASISQKGLTAGSVLITVFLMFVGGSSGGTAGGVKTGTVAVLFIAVLAIVRGQDDITAFKRRIPLATIRKALAVICISITVSLFALILMFFFVDGSALDITFEVYSALGTAGLSRDFTANLNLIGKCIIIACMFLGRIGPMSMVLAFTMRKTQEPTRFVEEDITVG